MRLNLASGTHPTDLPGWVNVDLPWDGVVDPDVYGDAFALPFRTGSFEAAYVGHVLEHVPWGDLPAMLGEVRRVLAPGAVVAVVGPDIELAIATCQPEWLLRAIDTLGGGPGGHKWVATETLTVEALRAVFPTAAAVPVGRVAPPEWPNVSTAPWQCAALAHA